MRYLCVQCNAKIVQHSTGGHYSTAQMRYSVTFKILCLEMLCQFLVGKLIGKSPVIEFKSKVFAAETLLETVFHAALEKHLLWTEIYKQFVDVIESTLGNKELAGRYIKKRDTAHRLAEVHRSKEVILFIIKHIVIY